MSNTAEIEVNLRFLTKFSLAFATLADQYSGRNNYDCAISMLQTILCFNDTKEIVDIEDRYVVFRLSAYFKHGLVEKTTDEFRELENTDFACELTKLFKAFGHNHKATKLFLHLALSNAVNECRYNNGSVQHNHDISGLMNYVSTCVPLQSLDLESEINQKAISEYQSFIDKYPSSLKKMSSNLEMFENNDVMAHAKSVIEECHGRMGNFFKCYTKGDFKIKGFSFFDENYYNDVFLNSEKAHAQYISIKTGRTAITDDNNFFVCMTPAIILDFDFISFAKDILA